ncbi:hypothetical protein CSB20_07905 [bacterium DOLZORAL124_64_63]|nr:MAG: hypothetical protein CSB20_07905 [bacterium DOLZORAL124_64_63]
MGQLPVLPVLPVLAILPVLPVLARGAACSGGAVQVVESAPTILAGFAGRASFSSAAGMTEKVGLPSGARVGLPTTRFAAGRRGQNQILGRIGRILLGAMGSVAGGETAAGEMQVRGAGQDQKAQQVLPVWHVVRKIQVPDGGGDPDVVGQDRNNQTGEAGQSGGIGHPGDRVAPPDQVEAPEKDDSFFVVFPGGHQDGVRPGPDGQLIALPQGGYRSIGGAVAQYGPPRGDMDGGHGGKGDIRQGLIGTAKGQTKGQAKDQQKQNQPAHIPLPTLRRTKPATV